MVLYLRIMNRESENRNGENLSPNEQRAYRRTSRIRSDPLC